MADYIAAARTNFFKVKDLQKFEEMVAANLTDVTVEHGDNGTVMLHTNDCDHGTWPTTKFADDGDDTEIDIGQLVSEHLPKGEVAVFIEAGSCKLQYVAGFAFAVNWRGNRVQLHTDDIYAMAKKKFRVDTISHASN